MGESEFDSEYLNSLVMLAQQLGIKSLVKVGQRMIEKNVKKYSNWPDWLCLQTFDKDLAAATVAAVAV